MQAKRRNRGNRVQYIVSIRDGDAFEFRRVEEEQRRYLEDRANYPQVKMPDAVLIPRQNIPYIARVGVQHQEYRQRAGAASERVRLSAMASVDTTPKSRIVENDAPPFTTNAREKEET